MTNESATAPVRSDRPAGPVRHLPCPGVRPAVPGPARAVLRPGRWDGRVRAYRADVTAEGPVGGVPVAVLLGRYTGPSGGLALRWLRGQARRIADGLDPDPVTARWAAEGTLGRVPDRPGRSADVPAELRRWCADEERQRAAAERLAQGLSFRLTAADHTGSYALRVWPVGVVVPRSGTSPLTYVRWPHQLPPWSPEPRPAAASPHRGAGSHPLSR
ncbi:hypothetical protein [Streptomyces radiopugnans]|uniref:Uncharacterized protein n=1 Tax=Streptomyces radiopugnans TaxID=403935 RepID=A0A1H9GB36_9ACTN|nr:hypothetical protein [Streptomyces radiopugnans]SEQ47223.1 hypothetical protein SAMN05216481_108190 [Streptomyces radiopugnans]